MKLNACIVLKHMLYDETLIPGERDEMFRLFILFFILNDEIYIYIYIYIYEGKIVFYSIEKHKMPKMVHFEINL